MPTLRTEKTGGSSRSAVEVTPGFDPGLLVIALLVLAGACAVLTVDVARTGYGVKADEATYVAMATSVAYDADLVYDSRDITRLYQVYEGGPQGIFLKRGGGAHNRDDRLYFGKAYVYPVVAAPFVRLAGLNGMLLLHVLLLGGMLLAAYLFLAARSTRVVALLSASAFFGVSIVPLHAVFLAPEIFNASCVTFAYFCWLYKEVAPRRRERWAVWLWAPGSDVVAAVLLGLATFSKPSHALLILPLVVLAVVRRRVRFGALVALVFVWVVAGGFTINAAITGEVNYQGGVRKTFYGTYPFEHPEVTFDSGGSAITTNEVDDDAWRAGFGSLLPTNLRYFLIGRHFGFVPFYFPGVVVIALFFMARERHAWQWGTLCAVVLSAVILSATMPYTWSGGGGSPGNRYFLSIYPPLLFLSPVLTSIVPAVVAWVGGALFTAHILVNPFVSAKQPYLSAERGLQRALPVELTMVDDLPIALDWTRHRVAYPSDPELLLSFLDRNVHRSEELGLWVAGGSRTDIILRSGPRLSSLTVTVRAPVANRVTVLLGGDRETIELSPGVENQMTLRPSGLHARGRWVYVLSVRTSAGFIPSLHVPGAQDDRFLGALIELTPHVGHVCAACQDAAGQCAR